MTDKPNQSQQPDDFDPLKESGPENDIQAPAPGITRVENGQMFDASGKAKGTAPPPQLADTTVPEGWVETKIGPKQSAQDDTKVPDGWVETPVVKSGPPKPLMPIFIPGYGAVDADKIKDFAAGDNTALGAVINQAKAQYENIKNVVTGQAPVSSLRDVQGEAEAQHYANKLKEMWSSGFVGKEAATVAQIAAGQKPITALVTDPAQDLRNTAEQWLTKKGSMVVAGAEAMNDMAQGNIKEGIGKLVDAGIAALGNHTVPNSPLEKAMREYDPNFKAQGHEPETDDGYRDWKELPVVDFAQFVDKKQHPIAKAISEIGQGMTSPTNMAILAATGGAGMTGSAAKINMGQRLLDAGFAAESIGGAYQNLDAFKKAYDEGDAPEAIYQLTHALGGASVGLMAGTAATGEHMPLLSPTDAKVAAGIFNYTGKALAPFATPVAKITAALSKAEGAEQVVDNIQRIKDPTTGKAAIYPEQLKIAKPQLVQVMMDNPNIDSPRSMVSAITNHIQRIETQLRDLARRMQGDPRSEMVDAKNRINTKISEAFAEQAGAWSDAEMNSARKSVMDRVLRPDETKTPDENGVRPTRAPNHFEVENLRRALNEETATDNTGALAAAKQAAAAEIRELSYDKFKELGVQDVDEWRHQEAALIDVRKNVERAIVQADKMGEANSLLQLTKMHKWGMLGGLVAIGGELFAHSPEGMIAPMLGYALDTYLKYRDNVRRNPSTYVKRAVGIAADMQKRGEESGAAIPDVKIPPRPPQAPPATGGGPVAPPIEPTPEGMVETPIVRTPEEKAAEAQAKAEAAVKANQQAAPFAVGEELPPPIGDQAILGTTEEETRIHELAHWLKYRLMGMDVKRISSHLHPENIADDSTAATIVDASKLLGKDRIEAGIKQATGLTPDDFRAKMEQGGKLTKPEDANEHPLDILYKQMRDADAGKFHPEAVKDNIHDLLVAAHMGGAAEEVVHGKPMVSNRGMNGDKEFMNDLLDAAKINDPAIRKALKAKAAAESLDLARQHAAVLEKYSKFREAGTPIELHFKPETLSKAWQEVNGNGKIQETGEREELRQPQRNAAEGPERREEDVTGAEGRPAQEPTSQLRNQSERVEKAIPTGDPRVDRVFADAGARPKGVMKLGEFGTIWLFDDPTTGTTLGIKGDPEEVTPLAVAEQLQKSRETYRKAAEKRDNEIKAKMATAPEDVADEDKRINTMPAYNIKLDPNTAGAKISKPFTAYHEAMDSETNPWVRRSADPAHSMDVNNGHRALMIQFSSDLIQKGGLKDEASGYYDKLYSGKREGYARLQDFWEIPQWMGFLSHVLPDADMYVVRDMAEAKQFLNEAQYGRVAFSALDVNKGLIRELAKDYKGRVDIGGYVDPNTFFDLPNTKFHPDIQSMAKDAGVEYKYGVDYRHFEGSDVIPRLSMSNGCLHECAFCAVPRKLDVVPKEVIDQQADAIAKLGSKLVYLNDKTFGQASNYTDLVEMNKRMKQINPDFKGFVAQTTAAQMNKLTPEFLKNSGIKFMELGIESYNDPILKEMKKPANERLINSATQKLREAGIALIPNIIVGLPGETAETYAHTLNWLKENDDIISHANIYNLALYKETALGKKITTATEGDFNENVLEKSFHEDPAVHRTFAGELYGRMGAKLDQPFEPGQYQNLTAGEMKAQQRTRSGAPKDIRDVKEEDIHPDNWVPGVRQEHQAPMAAHPAITKLEQSEDENVRPVPYSADAPFNNRTMPSMILPDGRIIPARVAHADVAQAAGFNGDTGGVRDFQKNTGAIRVIYPTYGKAASLGIELYAEPTSDQIRIVADAFKKTALAGRGNRSLVWDIAPAGGGKMVSGNGSIGEFRRAVDAAFAPQQPSSIVGNAIDKMLAAPLDQLRRMWPGKAAVALRNERGFTYNPVTGKIPRTGTSVDIFPERDRNLEDEVTTADIRRYVADNRDILEKHPELHVGGWGNQLNIAGRFGDEVKAIEAAKKLDQQSAWSLDRNEEIPAGGTGNTKVFPQYAEDQRLADLTASHGPEIKAKQQAAPPTDADKMVDEVGERHNYFVHRPYHYDADDLGMHGSFILPDGSAISPKDPGDIHLNLYDRFGKGLENAVRFAGADNVELFGRPTDAQIAQIARVHKEDGSEHGLFWDFNDRDEKRGTGEAYEGLWKHTPALYKNTDLLDSGTGSLVDFRRAIDKHYPTAEMKAPMANRQEEQDLQKELIEQGQRAGHGGVGHDSALGSGFAFNAEHNDFATGSDMGKGGKAWLTPDGKFLPVPKVHEYAKPEGTDDIVDAIEKGHIRVGNLEQEGPVLLEVGKEPTEAQRAAISGDIRKQGGVIYDLSGWIDRDSQQESGRATTPGDFWRKVDKFYNPPPEIKSQMKAAPMYPENPEDLQHISPELLKYMQPDEINKISGNKTAQKNVQKAYDAIPASMTDEAKAAVVAGQHLLGWWQRYIDTFAALGDKATAAKITELGPEHAEALKAWHAAVSGNKAVESANKLAWSSYADWLDAGRPRDRRSIDIMAKEGGGLSDTHNRKGEVLSEGLDTTKLFKLVNSAQMRDVNPEAFHHEVFNKENPSPVYGISSGAAKIPSMAATVAGEGNLNRLVLDTHMKDFYGANNWTDNSYIAHSIHLRQVAESLGMKPGEVQETIWGTVLGIKQLLGERVPDVDVPAQLTHELISSIGKDYAEVIKNDPELSDIAERLEKHGLRINSPELQAQLEDIVRAHRRPVEAPGVNQGVLANTAARIRAGGTFPEPEDTGFLFGHNAPEIKAAQTTGGLNTLARKK